MKNNNNKIEITQKLINKFESTEKESVAWSKDIIAPKGYEQVKLDHPECLIWKGPLSKTNKRETSFDIRPKVNNRFAHRVSYAIANNLQELPPAKVCILHLCSNTLCVNPNHLVLGSKKENMRHKTDQKRGGLNQEKKLNLELAKEIRDRYNTGVYTQDELAAQYNVTGKTISGVVNGKYYNPERLTDLNQSGFKLAYAPRTKSRKLSDKDIQTIRSLFNHDVPFRKIAPLFKIALSTLSKIISGETYKDVL